MCFSKLSESVYNFLDFAKCHDVLGTGTTSEHFHPEGTCPVDRLIENLGHRLIDTCSSTFFNILAPLAFEVHTWFNIHACLVLYRRNWLSACAYNARQQENMHLTKSMHLTGSMRLIKVDKRGRRGVRKQCAEGRKAYTTVAKKRSESVILDVSLLQPTSNLSGIM